MQFCQVNRPEVVMESFEGEVILVQMKTGNYYSLQGSGQVIWDLIERGRSVEEIGDWLVANCEGDAEEIRCALRNLVNDLTGEGLITPSQGTSASGAQDTLPPRESRQPFAAPVLERYTDMQELLLLDPIHDVDESGWPARKIQGEN